MHLKKISSILVALVTTTVAVLSAQNQAQLSGIVRSQDGSGIVGAVVRSDAGDSTVTSTGGRFRMTVPSNRAIVITVTAVGHTPEQLSVGAINSGTTKDIGVTLAKLYRLDAVSVVAGRIRPLLNTEETATGGAMEGLELSILPTDSRDPLSLAFTFPGVVQSTGFFGDAPPLSITGANSLYTQYLIDGLDNNEGFLGGPRVELPLSSMHRLDVQSTNYSSQYGRSSNGVVLQESRAGGQQPFREIFAYWRPGTPIDADPKIVPGGTDPDGFRRFQGGGTIAGRLSSDRLFGFLSAEYSNETEDRIGSTAQTSFIGTELREKGKVLGRLDMGWNENQTTTLRFAGSITNRAGRGSGVVVPEADITTRRIGSSSAITHRSAWGGGTAKNEVSFQVGTFRWDFPPTRSDFETPQVTVVGPDGTTVQAVVGSSNFIFEETETQFQLRDVAEWRLGKHSLRIGGDLIRSSFKLTGAQTNPLGAYVVVNEGNITPSGRFLSIDDIPDNVRVQSYTIDANPQQVDLTQTLVSGFVEDRFRVSPQLLITAGLRWDYDDITSRGASSPDLNNFQPRLGATLLANSRTVIRGSVGAYTGKFPYAVFSDAVQFGPNGNATVTFAEGTSFPPPTFLQGPTASDLAALQNQLPPREQREMFALGLEQPRSWQFTTGFQTQIGDRWSLSVDGVIVETRNLPFSVDLNPISRQLTAADSVDRTTDFGDQFRETTPTAGGFRRLTTTASGGKSTYRGLFTTIRRALSQQWSLEGNWVWSRAQNDTEDINFNATQGNCFSEDRVDAVTGEACNSTEWADAINDRRHRVSLRAFGTLSDKLRVAIIGDYQTGIPINRIAFFRDLDGSGDIFGNGFVGNHDRFLGVDRNDERLPSFFELNASGSYLLSLANGVLELRGDVFNLFNRTDWGNSQNGVPGGGSRTQVGRPGDPVELRAPGRPRQVQFSMRYLF